MLGPAAGVGGCMHSAMTCSSQCATHQDCADSTSSTFPELCGDGMHLSPAGAKALAPHVEAIIKEPHACRLLRCVTMPSIFWGLCEPRDYSMSTSAALRNSLGKCKHLSTDSAIIITCLRRGDSSKIKRLRACVREPLLKEHQACA